MFQKRKPIRIKKIRESARGQECTGNTPWCNYDSDTVVGAHYGEAGEKGIAFKPDDTSLAYLCSKCHDWLDGRFQPPDSLSWDERDKEWYWFRAMRRTWRLLVDNEVLK